MARIDFRQILLEQQEELLLNKKTSLVFRDKEKEIDTQSNLAQIITGIRRCGKSTLAQMALMKLKYGFVNFDDERLYDLQPEDLNLMLEALYTVYGDFEYLLLDEIQNVEGWHLFVNRLLRNKIRIVITGSNSNLLSREMATHLTGRYSIVELLPFSYGEYLEAKNIKLKPLDTTKGKGLAMNIFMEYLFNGGFPEVAGGENRKTYVANLFEAIVTRDIIFRYKIRHVRVFREISLWLTANYGAEISYNRIKNIFSLGSENTAKNYVSYLEEAWLFISLSKFSFKKQESLRNRKLYLIDTSFADLAGESGSENTGRLLENVVMLHLLRNRLRHGYEIFYYKKNVEVDFLIYRQRAVYELIQVSLSIENKKTRDREIRALLSANRELKATKLTIITMHEDEKIEQDGIVINVIPVINWILEDVIPEQV
jgi:hypothetical protein